jgi:transcriptional regulator with XRE-family HTH domain
MTVVPLHAVPMTEADYERQRAEIRETYGENKKQAGVRWEQALATLFYRSGWTQEELAKKEGKSQSHISRQLLFGRFLNFMSTDINTEKAPINLSEKQFRIYWEQTDKKINEGARSYAVVKLMAEKPSVNRQLAPLIRATLSDGHWRSIQEVAREAKASEADVERTLEGIKKHAELPKVKCERKKVGREFHYRLFPLDKTVSLKELKTKLRPLIDGLKAEGKKNMTTMSPGTVAHLTFLIQKLLDGWAE